MVHALILVLSAVSLFRFWVRTRFWLPRYVHVLAGIGLVVMISVVSFAPADAPVNKWGWLGRFLLALALPAMIYVFFVLYRGQKTAFERSIAARVPCPFCSASLSAGPNSIEVGSGTRFLESQCAHCGQTLPG